MCQKQKNSNNNDQCNSSSSYNDARKIFRICVIALAFVFVLNLIWYGFEQIWVGPPSSLSYADGFQLTINIIFMCVIAYLQYRIERKWNDANNEQQKFEKELELKGIISDRIHSLSETNQLSVTGYIPVSRENESAVYYTKPIQHIIGSKKYSLLICIEAFGQPSIFPACYTFDDVTLQYCGLNIDKNNMQYNSACLAFGIDDSKCNDEIANKILSSLINTLYFNQAGHDFEGIECCLTAKVKDTSHPAYNMEKKEFSKEKLPFDLEIKFSLFPDSGFCDEFGRFKMRIELNSISVLEDENTKKDKNTK